MWEFIASNGTIFWSITTFLFLCLVYFGFSAAKTLDQAFDEGAPFIAIITKILPVGFFLILLVISLGLQLIALVIVS